MPKQFLLDVDGEPVGSLRSFQGLDAWRPGRRRRSGGFIDRDPRDKHEKSGRVTLLAANAKDELATIALGNVGLRKFSHGEAEGTDGAIAVESLCRKLGLTVTA